MNATSQSKPVEPGDAVDDPCPDCGLQQVVVEEIDENPGVDVAHSKCGECGSAGFIYLD